MKKLLPSAVALSILVPQRRRFLQREETNKGNTLHKLIGELLLELRKPRILLEFIGKTSLSMYDQSTYDV